MIRPCGTPVKGGARNNLTPWPACGRCGPVGQESTARVDTCAGSVSAARILLPASMSWIHRQCRDARLGARQPVPQQGHDHCAEDWHQCFLPRSCLHCPRFATTCEASHGCGLPSQPGPGRAGILENLPARPQNLIRQAPLATRPRSAGMALDKNLSCLYSQFRLA